MSAQEIGASGAVRYRPPWRHTGGPRRYARDGDGIWRPGPGLRLHGPDGGRSRLDPVQYKSRLFTRRDRHGGRWPALGPGLGSSRYQAAAGNRRDRHGLVVVRDGHAAVADDLLHRQPDLWRLWVFGSFFGPRFGGGGGGSPARP